LIEGRRAFLQGKLDRAALRTVEDAAIADCVAMQEAVGLQAVTDGEYRRSSWREGFFENVDGFSADRVEATFTFCLADGSTRRARPIPRVVGKLSRRSGIATEEFRFLSKLTRRTAKLTLPAPSVMHWFGGDSILDRAIYRDTECYMRDVVAILREEVTELAALGCRHLQFDEVALPLMCDPGIRAQIADRGEDADRLIDLYVRVINEAIAARPADMVVCVHMCRGNEGDGMGGGGYRPIGKRAFGGLNVNGFFLEYDTPRAGDFTPLAEMPTDRTIALGLISTKKRELETIEELHRRVDEAAHHFDKDRLCLSPQCGFASGFQYDRLTIADERAKLERLLEAANVIW
jgi:methionine synthase II (cobalamin-independent)